MGTNGTTTQRHTFTLVVEERDDLDASLSKENLAKFIKTLLERDAYLYVAAIGWTEGEP